MLVSAYTEACSANQYASVSCQKCLICTELYHTGKHLVFSKSSSSQPWPTHEAYGNQETRLMREVRWGSKEGTQLWKNHFLLFCHCLEVSDVPSCGTASPAQERKFRLAKCLHLLHLFGVSKRWREKLSLPEFRRYTEQSVFGIQRSIRRVTVVY